MRKRSLSHRPSQELIDLRQSGLPWLTAATLLILLLVILGVVYLTTKTDDAKSRLEDYDIIDGDDKIVPIIMRNSTEAGRIENYNETVTTTKVFSNEDTEVMKQPSTTSTVEGSITVTDRPTPAVTTPLDASLEPPGTIARGSLVPTTTVTSSTSATPTVTQAPATTVTPTVTKDPIASVIPIVTHAPTTTQIPTLLRYPIKNVVPTVTSTNPEAIDVRTTVTTTVTSTSPRPIVNGTIVRPTVPPTTEATTTITPTPPRRPISGITTTTALPTVSRHSPTTVTTTNTSATAKPAVNLFKKSAVISNHPSCSDIALKILRRGGNVIDGALAAEICQSAVHPHATGPAYGLVILVSGAHQNIVIDGREQTPRNLRKDLFVDNPRLATFGYSSICVPGWLTAIKRAHSRYGSGKISWSELFQPTLEFIKSGVQIDQFLSNAYERRRGYISKEKSLRSIFNKPSGTYKDTVFFSFLEHLSKLDEDLLDTNLTDLIAAEMKQRGGLITKEELINYHSIEELPQRLEKNGVSMLVPVFSRTIGATQEKQSAQYEKPVGQVSSIQVGDTDGNLAVIVSTNNYAFGSVRRSEKLGVVWNSCVHKFKTDCGSEEEDCLRASQKPSIISTPVIVTIGEETSSTVISTSNDSKKLLNNIQRGEDTSLPILRIGRAGIYVSCGKKGSCHFDGY